MLERFRTEWLSGLVPGWGVQGVLSRRPGFVNFAEAILLPAAETLSPSCRNPQPPPLPTVGFLEAQGLGPRAFRVLRAFRKRSEA